MLDRLLVSLMTSVIPGVYEAGTSTQRRQKWRALVQCCNQVILNLVRRSGPPFRNLVPRRLITNSSLMSDGCNGWSEDGAPIRGQAGDTITPLPVTTLERQGANETTRVLWTSNETQPVSGITTVVRLEPETSSEVRRPISPDDLD